MESIYENIKTINKSTLNKKDSPEMEDFFCQKISIRIPTQYLKKSTQKPHGHPHGHSVHDAPLFTPSQPLMDTY